MLSTHARGTGQASEREAEAVFALSFPPHPATVFDEPKLRQLIAYSRSFTLLEKLETIRGCALYSQAEINGLIAMLAREREEQLQERTAIFERWAMESTSPREQIYANCKALLGGAPLSEALSPSAAATALESAAPGVLAILGAGETQAVFETLLRRLAQQMRDTGRAWMEGTVTELFAPELAVAVDRAGFVRKMINPALTKLRVNAIEPTVTVGDHLYAVRLIVERRSDDLGGKKPLYRFTALVRRDTFHTRFERYRDGVTCAAVSLIEEPVLEAIAHRLGVSGIVRKALVPTVENKSERKLVFYDLLRSTIGRLCRVLPAVEQQSLFASAFKFDLRYDASAEPIFEDAFTDAVVIREHGPEDLSAAFFRDGLRVSRLFTFVDRLFLLHAYVFGSSRERFQLRTLLDVANFEYRGEHTLVEASKLASPTDLRQVLANHVNDVPAYFQLLEMDLRDEQYVRNALAAKSGTLHGVLRVARALERP